MKDKKELTPKQHQQRNKLLVYPLMGFAFCLVMYFIFVPSSIKENKEDIVNGLNAEVPLPKDQIITADKKTAYEQEQLKKQQEEKMRTLQDYAFALTGKEETEELNLMEETTEEGEPGKQNGGGRSSRFNSIETSHNAYRNMTKELNSIYAPDQNDTEKKKLEEKIAELTKQLEETPKDNPIDQIDLMEKSYKMAAKYLTPGTTAGDQQQPEKPGAAVQPATSNKETNITPVTGISENIVSQLKQEITDSAFMSEYVKPRNMGFITAVKTVGENSRNTINACVLETQVLNFGNGEDQKVRFRLLEDVQAGTMAIPRNSIFSGDAKIQGGRLEVTITTIEHSGNIIPVKLQVYDLDGQKGINAHGSMEVDALKEAAGNISGNMGTAITFTQNAGQQIASDLAKTAIQTGTQYLGKKIKTVKVTLKTNHQVFLLAQNK